MDYQWYPTPASLARRAWSLFKDKEHLRVLEPSAGNGDLLDVLKDESGRRPTIDCCEIDLARHPILREKGYSVVGTDFLAMESLNIYSHVIANPPFHSGVAHLLHAWERVWDAELVFILNAESVKNPFTADRKRLVHLIEQYGTVEFARGAFATEEAQRKTEVEVALVWLRKEAPVTDILGDLINELKADQRDGKALAEGYEELNQVALPASVIENAVAAFNAAVMAMQDAVKARARQNYYARILGETMAVRSGSAESSKPNTSAKWMQGEIEEGYKDLKDRAWSGILRGTQIESRLSSKAQRRLEADFETIKRLEFTTANIYGFLCGLIDNQQTIQLEMICDVFDSISKHHTDNAHLYRGWKSNDRHRTQAMRIKMTRFILPGFESERWQRGLGYNAIRSLSDFDRVFAMLDGGKLRPEVGLVDIFERDFEALRSGERVASSYFECRYYPRAGTVHFFPSRKYLIDALNRYVGRHRQWLPPTQEQANADFWIQYDQASRFDSEVRKELKKAVTDRWFDPFRKLRCGTEREQAEAADHFEKAFTTVFDRHGLKPESRLAGPVQQQQLLLEST